ncbi:hypothetical protein T4A_13075 [Trichinella pseudospiralis]|uniref:Uncharacterized protein n=1 Tax=Trichinella pseudospiralis TaxID=6337 RepID=A0A0V1E5P7_TRIPS|nr:hypothetical protein T4A_13075 [Trichinella pseudospiralis]
MTGEKESKNKADKIRKSEKSYGNLIKRPIRDKEALYPWSIRHFDGVQLALAVRN